MLRPSRSLRSSFRIPTALSILAACMLFPCLAAPTAASDPAPRRAIAPISPAGEELMLEIWDAGGLKTNGYVQRALERRQLREAAFAASEGDAIAPASEFRPLAQPPYLAADVGVNSPTPLICGCNNLPLSQAETTIAVWGRYVLVSYNDNAWRCLGPGVWGSQGHGYSSNYGATFKDGGVLAGPTTNQVFHGDPTVSVNRKTGAFYISGILRAGALFTGVVALKGHFEADSFVIDVRRDIALAQGDDFLDKPWMTADSVSGNVYVTWTNFKADGYTGQIELQRCDANLNALGPVQVIHSNSGDLDYSPQGSYPTVGPSGELYIPWTDYTVQFAGPLADHRVVRSNDFGATFGPEHIIATNEYNGFSGGPGSRRGFGGDDPAMAVDMTGGPHRGRAYVVFDATAQFRDAPFGAYTAAFEKETNNTFAAANSFVPGGKIRGSLNTTDIDVWKFTGHRGQMLVLRPDTVTTCCSILRIICSNSNDASTVANWHSLVYTGLSSGGAVCGLPYDGTYYIRIGPDAQEQVSNGIYAISTAFDTPTAGDIARDERDQMLCWSDDGASWSAPVRLNDSDPGFDGCFPSVTVDGRGRVHCFWLDWRSDPVCGDLSDDYMTSSGDGGVTWGANRRISDVSSYWGFMASCSGANHGDYVQIASEGDRVYPCFPDARLGSPDVFVDPSIFNMTASCPPGGAIPAGRDTVLQFVLTNGGNFDTPLAWRVIDDAGWLSGATPAASGSQTLGANGGTLIVAATLHPPGACTGASSLVRFITWDPAIPSAYDTCRVAVNCVNGTTPALLSLVSAEALSDRVTLTWYRGDGDLAGANVNRRRDGEGWTALGSGTFDGTGRLRFEDRAVEPGVRYAYRLAWTESGVERTSDASWVLVPVGLALALEGLRPNPAGDDLRVALTLTGDAPATLEMIDVSGRRVLAREIGALGAGRHVVALDEAGRAPAGVYWLRLTQSGRTRVRPAVVVR
jgi:hypothetical protein